MRHGIIALTLATALGLAPTTQARAQTPPYPAIGEPPPPDTTARRSTLDSLTDRWNNDSLSTVVDGQPDPPGGGEIVGEIGWLHHEVGPEPLRLGMSAWYTPAGTGLWRNMLLGVLVPLRWDRRGPRFDAIGFAWQQRWLASVRSRLSLASYIQADLLTLSDDAEAMLTVVGVAAAVLGPGVGYLNGAIIAAEGSDNSAWYLLAAYKLPLSNTSYLHLGLVSLDESGEPSTSTLELAAVFTTGSRLKVSPGIVLGLARHETTPLWGAGLSLTYSF